MPDYEFLKYVETDGVARITLNRPDKINSLTVKMSAELHDAITRVRDSTSLKVLVIDGAGGNSAPATTSPRCRAGATPTTSCAAPSSTRRWPISSRTSTR